MHLFFISFSFLFLSLVWILSSSFQGITDSNTIILLLYVELCGTPGYLSPEILQCSMFADAPGYGKEVDM